MRPIVLLLLLACAAPAETPEEAAVRAREAFRAGDGAVLRAIAEASDPDPWLVADELCALSEEDAALALAADLPHLRAAVEALKRQPAPAEVRARLRELYLVNEARNIGLEELRRRVPGFRPAFATIPDLRLAAGYASALLRAGEPGAAIELAARTAEECERAGWRRRALELVKIQAIGLAAAGEPVRAIELAASAATRAREGGERRVLADLLLLAATLRVQASGRPAEAEVVAEAAGIYAQLGEKRLAALAYSMEGFARKGRAAVEPLRRAIDLAREVGDFEEERRALLYLTVALMAEDDWDGLERACDEALARLDATPGSTGRTYYHELKQSNALQSRDWNAALRASEALAEVAAAEGQRRAVVKAIIHQGIALRHLGEIAAAAACAERALPLARELDDASRLSEGPALATLLLVLQRPRDAAAIYRESALAFGSQPDQLVLTLNLLCAAELAAGDAAAALATARRQREVAERLGTKAHAVAWGTVGRAHLALDDLPAAFDAFERSATLAEAAGDAAATAGALELLASGLQEIGDIDRAVAMQERAVAVRPALSFDIARARTLHNLSLYYHLQGRPPEAIGTAREALALLVAGKWPSEESRTRNVLGLALGAMGMPAEAAAEFTLALELARGAGNRSHECSPLINLSSLAQDRGEFDRAETLAREALAVAEETGEETVRAHYRLARIAMARAKPAEAIPHLAETMRDYVRFDRLSEEQAATAYSDRVGSLALCFDASALAGRPEDALRFLEMGRGRALLVALGGRDKLRDIVVPAEPRAEEAGALERRRLAQAGCAQAVETGNRKEIAYWRDRLREADTEVSESAGRIQREAKRAAGLYCMAPATLAEIQSWLRADEALVLLGPGTERYRALVVGRAGARFAELDREALLPGDDPPAPTGPEAATLARRLAEGLELAPSARRVLLCPPAELTLLPWCLALGDRELAYIPSATVYGLVRAAPRATGTRILALGDPATDAPPLPSAEAEARTIGDLVLTGAAATEAALLRAASEPEGWRAIHLACHANADAERPLQSRLRLAPGDGSDGDLTAREVLALDLRTGLLALSACETGTGKSHRGEGVLGLARAFLHAGAPRVLVSLWKVDDAATAALMTTFYRGWRGGAGAAEALRRAQRAVASEERWKEPRYWAAWQLWGLAD